MANVLRRIALGEVRAVGAPVFDGMSKVDPRFVGSTADVEVYSTWDRRSNNCPRSGQVVWTTPRSLVVRPALGNKCHGK